MTGRSLNDTVPGDDVDLTGGSATFEDKNVGTGKTVSLAGAVLDGVDAGNYELGSVATTTADITVLEVTGEFDSANKVYDGNTSAAASNRDLVGEVSGDDVSLTGGVATFGSKNVGTGKTVTLSGASLAGADAGNYNLTVVDTTTADITALDISGVFDSANKVYDGNSSAAASNRDLLGRVVGDDVSLTGGVATFEDKNVGAGKTVTLSGASLAGEDAGNYDLTGVDTVTADITALDISGVFASADKVYDGTRTAAATGRDLIGVLGADDVSLDGGTASFDAKNVGTGKTVTLTGAALAGADAGNYHLTGVATTTADITLAGVAVSFTADDKVYDGTTDAQILTRSLDGVAVGDVVTVTDGEASFEDKVVGTDKVVSAPAAGFVLGGADADNYSISSVEDTLAAITVRRITGSFTADGKVYDGDDSATVTGRSLNDTVPGDDVELTGGSATFEDKNVGTGKTVSLAGAALDGVDAGNYELGSVATTTADITVLEVTGEFDSADKVYDGDTSAAATGRRLVGEVSGDDVVLTGGSASFATKNVGAGKTVTLSDASLAGADAGNYDLTDVDTTTADITVARGITGAFDSANKVYDANTSAAATGPATRSGRSSTVTRCR